MRRSANVRSLDAVQSTKAALVEFREVVASALTEAQSEIQRTLWWIQHDRAAHWRREVKRRTEQLAQAKSELYRAQLAAMDPRAACVEQRKLVQQAEQRLAEAHEKIRLVKHWARVIDREMLLFRGQCQEVSRMIEVEIPQGEARLGQLLHRLHEYVDILPPDSRESPRPRETARRTGNTDGNAGDPAASTD